MPSEYVERYYPLRVESYGVRTDSGGAATTGAATVAKMYRFLEDGLLTFQDDRAHTYPWGINGGKHGEPSEKVIIRADGTEWHLPSKVENVPVRAGDRLMFSTAGAGGLGDPLDREISRAAFDVRAALISLETARADYGVVVSRHGTVDEDATGKLRADLRASRGDARGPAALQLGQELEGVAPPERSAQGRTRSRRP